MYHYLISHSLYENESLFPLRQKIVVVSENSEKQQNCCQFYYAHLHAANLFRWTLKSPSWVVPHFSEEYESGCYAGFWFFGEGGGGLTRNTGVV